MVAYRTPGVYINWAKPQETDIRRVRMDVAGFVGIAARGPLHEAVRIESWAQFRAIFGGHAPQGYLAYAVDGFFANGGRTCYVVRVASPAGAKTASVEIPDVRGRARLHLAATSPGSWGNSVLVWGQLAGAQAQRPSHSVLVSRRSLPPAPPDEGHFTLRLRGPDGEQEVFANLTLRTVAGVLADPETGSRLVRAEVQTYPDDDAALEMTPSPITPVFLNGGDDGLKEGSLQPAHFSGLDDENMAQPWGWRLLEAIDEISIVAAPDLMPKLPLVRHEHPKPDVDCRDLESPESLPLPPDETPDIPAPFPDDVRTRLQENLVAHCALMQDRVAILDSPFQFADPRAIQAHNVFNSPWAAYYYPWLRVTDPIRLDGLVRSVPPSGHVAGIYARLAAVRGVHEPPANQEIAGAMDLTAPTDDALHADLNDNGTNLIRAVPGRGIRVLGARTTAPDDPAWRYVNVRRLMTMIEKSVDISTQWLVFEPNSPDTWRETDRVVRGFIDGLWRDGMLDGATAAEAYSVVCDASNNPAFETDAGRLHCEIGVKPPWPAEFVIVTLRRTVAGIRAVEGMEARGG